MLLRDDRLDFNKNNIGQWPPIPALPSHIKSIKRKETWSRIENRRRLFSQDLHCYDSSTKLRQMTQLKEVLTRSRKFQVTPEHTAESPLLSGGTHRIHQDFPLGGRGISDHTEDSLSYRKFINESQHWVQALHSFVIFLSLSSTYMLALP